MSVKIKDFFDKDTATFTYVVSDPETSKAAVIDSVLDYDRDSGRSSTKSADKVMEYVRNKKLKIEWVLDTHIHADHLTASHYIKEKLGGKIAIGDHIKDVLKFWVPIFNTKHDTPLDGSQFDVLLADNQIIKLGNKEIRVMHTPGHTPACSCYLIEDAVFVGDTIFMPDLGTARTDFPGGSAETMYDSIQRLLSLPDSTRIFVCHDYPPETRGIKFMATVKEHKEKNVMINSRVSKAEYVAARNKRDEGKPVPKLLLPSIQVNMRAGRFGDAEGNGVKYVKIPLNKI